MCRFWLRCSRWAAGRRCWRRRRIRLWRSSAPAATSERRLNFAQSFNPPGTILGVILGARFIFSGVELKAPEVAAMKAGRDLCGLSAHRVVARRADLSCAGVDGAAVRGVAVADEVSVDAQASMRT